MRCSIIIVSWNTRQLLETCLASIYAHPPAGEFEVWVVDNVSTDGSPEMVKACFPQVRLVENQKNVGFAQGNNQAIRLCSGKWVLLLNPDTEVRPAALETLVKFIEEHPELGAAGARLLNPDGSLQVSAYPAPTLGRELWRLFHLDRIHPLAVYPMHTWPVNRAQTVDVLMGACLLLRREALDGIGLMDESYFIYSEEVDLCTRLQRAGWKLAWVPLSQVVHYGGQSTQQVANEMFLRLYQGKVLYFRKHEGPAAAAAYKLILFAAALARLALTPMAFLEQPAQRRKHLLISSHYRRLLGALPGM